MNRPFLFVISGVLSSLLLLTFIFCGAPLSHATVTFGEWQHKGTVIPSSAGHNPQQPSVIYESGAHILSGTVFKMWYNDFDGTNPQLSYAESTNGTTWTTYASNPILSGQGFAKVYKNGSTYYLYSSPSGFTTINVYTSTDGLSWTLQLANAVTTGTTGQWDSVNATQLNIIDVIGATWYGYYTGRNSTTAAWAMGLVTSSDGIHWTKGGSNPVITTNGPSNFDWHKINGIYWGWSQVTLPGSPSWLGATLDYPSDIQRFSSSSVTGPFTVLAPPSFQRTQTSEGVTSGAVPTADSQVADQCIVSDGTNLWMFFTATTHGNGGPWMINAAEAPSTTFAQLVATYGQIQSYPSYTQAGLALNQGIVGSDNFTRANENPVSGGGNWVGMGDAFAANGQVLSNTLVGTSTTKAGIQLWNGTVNPDQWASITVSTAAETTSEVGVVLRASTSAATLYRLFWQGQLANAASSEFIIDCWVNGAQQFSIGFGFHFVVVNSGDVITGFINGNVLSIYQNGFLVATYTDTANTIATGQPGFNIYGGSTTATDASATAWNGGNIVASPVLSTRPFLPLVIRP